MALHLALSKSAHLRQFGQRGVYRDTPPLLDDDRQRRHPRQQLDLDELNAAGKTVRVVTGKVRVRTAAPRIHANEAKQIDGRVIDIKALTHSLQRPMEEPTDD